MIAVDQKLLNAAAVALRQALYSATDLNGHNLRVSHVSEEQCSIAARAALMNLMGWPCHGVVGSQELIVVQPDAKHVATMELFKP